MSSQSISIPEVAGFHQLVPQIDDALGVLFLGRDDQTGRPVQIRWLEGASSVTLQAMDQRYRQLTGSVAKNCQGVYDLKVTSEGIGLILNSSPRNDLAAWMSQKGGGLDEKEALRLIRRLTLSVESLHEAGIVGLDIRPGSVWVVDGEVTLGEQVSIAGAMADDAWSQRLLGSELGSERGFPPPEGPQDPSGDIYSLGAVLSFLVTGWNPIAGVANDPAAVNPDLSQPLVQVITKAMALIPTERYQTAEQFREDLEALSYDFAPLHAGQDLLSSSGEIVLPGAAPGTAAFSRAQTAVDPKPEAAEAAKAARATEVAEQAPVNTASPFNDAGKAAQAEESVSAKHSRRSSSKAPLFIGLAVVLAALAGGAWYDNQRGQLGPSADATMQQAALVTTETPASVPTVATPFLKPSWADGVGEDDYGFYAMLPLADVAIKMRYVAPTTMTMGPTTDGASQHVSITRPYFMAATELDQASFMAVMKKNPSHFKDDAKRLPVDSVSWQNAQQFITALNQKIPGAGFSLPTEAQWEVAARQGGDPVVSLSNADGIRQTSPVDSGAISAAGFYGLTGNVLEWCADGFVPYNPEGNLVDPVVADGIHRVVRGGAWTLSPIRSAVTERARYAPEAHFFFVGMRLAAVAQAAQ